MVVEASVRVALRFRRLSTKGYCDCRPKMIISSLDDGPIGRLVSPPGCAAV